MGIDTGLDLPSFNVIKYVIIFIIFDVAVRRSLRGILIFFRRRDLRHGRPVSLQGVRFDRYNLQGYSTICKSGASFFLFFLTLSVYCVEFFLEFSSDSSERIASVPGRVSVINASQEVCGIEKVRKRPISVFMTQLADDCIEIDVVNKQYTFYNYVWTRTKASTDQPLCVRADDNVLANGSLIYSPAEINAKSDDVLGAIRAASLGSNGDRNHAVISIPVKTENVFAHVNVEESGSNFTRSFFGVTVVHTDELNIKCYGNAFGRHGEGMMQAQISFCRVSDGRYIYLAGSGLIREDAKNMRTKSWTTEIPCLYGRVIGNFSHGLEHGFQRIQAYAMLLGTMFNPDDRSIQRYAALYHNCERVRVPENDIITSKTVPNAESRSVVTVEVKMWAIVLILSLSVALVFLSCLLSRIADHKKMPDHVYGERALARRWLRDKENLSNFASRLDNYPQSYHDESSEAGNWTNADQVGADIRGDDRGLGEIKPHRPSLFQFFVKRRNHLYLSVSRGEIKDDITISRSDQPVGREKSKPFEAL